MALGQGLHQLLQSPMAGGQQQQFPDPTNIVKQLMEQFAQYVQARSSPSKLTSGEVRERAPLAMGGGAGTPAIQAPVGTPPRERAGQLRTAAGEGAATFMEQAGEAAAEPWKPQALDIGLMAATIALPIIAAMQPEGRGRRGQRKQQRMSNLFKTLGGFAGQGLQARMGSFEAGKETEFGAAKEIADISLGEAKAQYGRTIGDIGAAESTRRWEAGHDLAERGMAVRERPKAGKPLFTAGQLYQQDRDVAADARREQKETEKRGYQEADRIWLSLPFAEEGENFKIDSAQSLNNAISRAEHLVISHPFMASNYEKIAQQLRKIRDQISGQGGGKPADMTDAEWQEYLQMKGQ